jgi:hypothetical protein
VAMCRRWLWRQDDVDGGPCRRWLWRHDDVATCHRWLWRQDDVTTCQLSVPPRAVAAGPTTLYGDRSWVMCGRPAVRGDGGMCHAHITISSGGMPAAIKRCFFFCNFIYRWSFLPICWGMWSFLSKFHVPLLPYLVQHYRRCTSPPLATRRHH